MPKSYFHNLEKLYETVSKELVFMLHKKPETSDETRTIPKMFSSLYTALTSCLFLYLYKKNYTRQQNIATLIIQGILCKTNLKKVPFPKCPRYSNFKGYLSQLINSIILILINTITFSSSLKDNLCVTYVNVCIYCC